MTAYLTRGDYERVALAIMDGATIDAAAVLVGVTGRTIERRMTADPAVDALIQKALAEREARRPQPECGTRTRYAAGCRCPLCREAEARAKRRQIARNRSGPMPATVKHGTDNAYSYWSCRCDACTHAHSLACRRYNDSLRERRTAS